jgi:hypothetical protein
MNRLAALIMVMLALTALYFIVTMVFKPSQPQVIVVRPSGGQGGQTAATNTAASEAPTPAPPPPVGGQYLCTKAVYLKVGGVSLCADVVYSMLKTDDSLQVDFQGGVVQGFFMFISAPSCAITTTPHGVLIPCRAQIQIPLKQ